MGSRYVKDIFEVIVGLRCMIPVSFTRGCDPLGKETWIGCVTEIGFSSREKVEHMWLEAPTSTIQVPLSVG